MLRYAGYVYDSESGLYYCTARYYDPATRQWTTADSAKADGEESAYQYCGGDPVGSRDPEGDKRLDVPKVLQAGAEYCGPACCKSIITWYWPKRDWSAHPGVGGANSGPSQAHEVTFVKNYPYTKGDLPPWNQDDVNTCLWGWSVASYTTDVDLVDYSDIKAQIDASQPMIVGTTTPEHWWVMCGCYKTNKGVKHVWLMNPAPGQYSVYHDYTLSYFRSYFGMDTFFGTSKWTG